MIVGTQGNQGRGKTALLTFLAKHYAGLGYRIYANYWIQIPGVQVTYVTTISELEKIHDGYVFLDEFWIWIDSRVSGFSDVNAAVTGILMNLRKRRCSLFYESKRMHFSDRRIRELTDYVLEPQIFFNNNGNLEVIEQDMLYPINMSMYIENLWVVTKKYRIISESRMQEVDDENDIVFRLSDIIHMYNTSEEIKSLSRTESIPGLQKGMKIEDAFEEYLRVLRPQGTIARDPASKNWDITITGACFDVISPRKPKLGSKQAPTIDTRKKAIRSHIDVAKDLGNIPYWAWCWEGVWYVRQMRYHDEEVVQIPAVGTRADVVIGKMLP